MSINEFQAQMIEARHDLTKAQEEHKACAYKAADADRKARLAKATAYLSASGTVDERRAYVDKATLDEQYEAKLAEDLKQSALEAIRSKRQELSAIQSLTAALREEAHLARYDGAA